MSHVVDDIVNPIGAVTGIDPVKQATGFTGTGFDKKPAAQAQQQQQSSGGSGGGQSGIAGNMLSQLVGQQQQQQQQQSQINQNPIQFHPSQVPQSGIGFGQQLSQLGPQPMQSAMNSMTKFFSQ